MKRYVIIMLFSLATCTDQAETNFEEWKKATTHQSEQRVNDVIAQLQEDCDSNLIQMAHYKADSVIQVRLKVRKKKK